MEVITEDIELLYCPVWPDEVDSALTDGVDSPDSSGVLLVNKDIYAAGLIKMISGVRINGWSEIDMDGKKLSAPMFDKFKNVCVVAIDVSALDRSLIEDVSADYSSGFYPHDMRSFAYSASIPAYAIVNHVHFELSSSDIPMQP